MEHGVLQSCGQSKAQRFSSSTRTSGPDLETKCTSRRLAFSQLPFTHRQPMSSTSRQPPHPAEGAPSPAQPSSSSSSVSSSEVVIGHRHCGVTKMLRSANPQFCLHLSCFPHNSGGECNKAPACGVLKHKRLCKHSHCSFVNSERFDEMTLLNLIQIAWFAHDSAFCSCF